MSSANVSLGQNRARSRGRGNRGKYLRARGRRGLGRAAEFAPRLLLEEDIGAGDLDVDEDDQDDAGKYAKREIVDNTEKYGDPSVEPNVVEGELEEPEPEVDLSGFLAKQRLKDPDHEQFLPQDSDEDVDISLSKLSVSASTSLKPQKNNIQTIEWDASMEELRKDKEAADAVRDLKSRFQNTRSRPVRSQLRRGTNKATREVEDLRHEPSSTNEGITESQPSTVKAQMETFLDDLLS